MRGVERSDVHVVAYLSYSGLLLTNTKWLEMVLDDVT